MGAQLAATIVGDIYFPAVPAIADESPVKRASPSPNLPSNSHCIATEAVVSDCLKNLANGNCNVCTVMALENAGTPETVVSIANVCDAPLNPLREAIPPPLKLAIKASICCLG